LDAVLNDEVRPVSPCSRISNKSIGSRFKAGLEAGLEARLGRCPKRRGKTCFPHVHASLTIP
jgi:hypothetical protein